MMNLINSVTRPSLLSNPLSRPLSTIDDDVMRIARRALMEAQAAGKDYLGQTRAAIHALQIARPEVATSDAMVVVNRVQRP